MIAKLTDAHCFEHKAPQEHMLFSQESSPLPFSNHMIYTCVSLFIKIQCAGDSMVQRMLKYWRI